MTGEARETHFRVPTLCYQLSNLSVSGVGSQTTRNCAAKSRLRENHLGLGPPKPALQNRRRATHRSLRVNSWGIWYRFFLAVGGSSTRNGKVRNDRKTVRCNRSKSSTSTETTPSCVEKRGAVD